MKGQKIVEFVVVWLVFFKSAAEGSASGLSALPDTQQLRGCLCTSSPAQIHLSLFLTRLRFLPIRLSRVSAPVAVH